MLAKKVNGLMSWRWVRRIGAIGVGLYAAGWFVAGVRMGFEIMGAVQ